MTVIAVPEALREKLGPEGARGLVELVNQATWSAREDVVATCAERFERRLAEEIGKLRADMAEFKAEMIRWMFVFWVGQVAVITGILFAFFR